MIKHMGMVLKHTKNGFVLTREKYIKVSKKSSFLKGESYSESWCRDHAINALINFDINMDYFRSLDKHEFLKSITNFLRYNPNFVEVKNLKDFIGKPGYYLMVLDEYRQAYIGTTSDLYKRINSHWHSSKEFDRLIFGGTRNSILSIDSFRPLDTTRLFVHVCENLYAYEDDYIDTIPAKFVCNRTRGGLLEFGLNQAIAKRKTRVETKTMTESEIHIQFSQERDASPLQLHEIYMIANSGQQFWHMVDDGIESEIVNFVYQGKYGQYELTSNRQTNTVTVVRISDFNWTIDPTTLLSSYGQYEIICRNCDQTHPMSMMFDKLDFEQYGSYKIGTCQVKCSCGNSIYLKIKFVIDSDELYSIALDYELLGGTVVRSSF